MTCIEIFPRQGSPIIGPIQAPKGDPRIRTTRTRIARHQDFREKWGINYQNRLSETFSSTVFRARLGYIAKENYPENPQSFEERQREIRILTQLAEEGVPHIPKVEDCHESPAEITIIYPDYGASLDVLYPSSKKLCPPENALFFLDQLLETLSFLEKTDRIHGAINPSNILFDHRSVILKGGWASMTQLPTNKNLLDASLNFAEMVAPELYNEASSCEYRFIDMWTLGATLFRIVTGENLFILEEDDPPHYSIVYHQLSQRFGEEAVKTYFTTDPVDIELLTHLQQKIIQKMEPCILVLEQAKNEILKSYPNHQRAYMAKICDRVNCCILGILAVNPRERPSATDTLNEMRRSPLQKKATPKKNDASFCNCTIS